MPDADPLEDKITMASKAAHDASEAGALEQPPLYRLGPEKAHERTSGLHIKDLITKEFTSPRGAALLFVTVRLFNASIWLTGALVKSPWRQFGWFPEWLMKESASNQIPLYKWFVDAVLIPHLTFFGWMQFLTELGLGVLLLMGFCSRLAGLAAALWSINIMIGSLWVPGEWWVTYVLLILAQLLVLATAAGRLLGVDAVLRPTWLAHDQKWKRLLAKWAM